MIHGDAFFRVPSCSMTVTKKDKPMAFNDLVKNHLCEERSGVASNGIVGCAIPRALAEPGKCP
jgi:hypothetical protein